MSWQDDARALSFGQKRKVVCCGTSPSTYISNSTRGVSLGPCFRCQYKDFERHDNLTAADILRMRQTTTELRGMQERPPTVGLADAPSEARVWVLRCGITPEVATGQYGFGWAERQRRVIVPILQDGEDTGAFIARSLDPRMKPKYVASANAAGKQWVGGEGVTVLVEDVLSAIVVSRAGFRGMAAMGTTFDDAMLNRATQTGKLVGWLDDDSAGKAAFRKLRKRMGLWDCDLYRVQSDRDPKLHSADAIRDLVHNAIGA